MRNRDDDSNGVANETKLGHDRAMTLQYKALAVHLLTATGAVLAMLAMLAAVDQKWGLMFLWLVVAFAVDGIDGPLARRYDVKTNAPQYDGVLLDLIIDYLTYVFIPAFALFKSGMLPGWIGWIVIIVVTFTSAVYFADTRMKTKDNSFSGFPGCWNMVAIVFFTINPNYWVMLGIIVALAVAMFAPLKFIHPVRTERWRWLSLPAAVLWTLFALWGAWNEFHPRGWEELGIMVSSPSQAIVYWGLVISSFYLLLAGVAQQVVPAKSA